MAARKAPRRSSLDRVREVCMALPGAEEVEAWGEPTFRVRNRIFAMYASSASHHGEGRPSLWCKSTPFTQDQMLQAEPARYFNPPYVGPKGWVGVFLDGRPDWPSVRALVEDAWRLTAPKRMHVMLDPKA